MNLAKKRKLTAIITLSVMIVAVVATACILTVPNLYKNEDITPTNTAAYGMGEVNYSNNYSSYLRVAYLANSDGNNKDIYSYILYPKAIYIDTSEELNNIGYKFLLRSKFAKDSERRIEYLSSTFGEWVGTAPTNVKTGTPYYAFMDNFDYSVSALTTGTNVWSDGVRNTTTNTGTGDASDKISKGKVIGIGSSANGEFFPTIIMNGSPKNTGHYVYESYNKSTSHYLSYKPWGINTKTTTVSGSERTGFNEVSGQIEVQGISAEATTGMSIDIYIYNKSSLQTKINNFRNEISNNATMLNAIGAKVNAETFIGNIEKDYLKKREVTNQQVLEAENMIDNYNWEVNKPTPINSEKEYDGNKVAETTFLATYNGGCHEFSYTMSSAAIGEIRNVGTYNVQVKIKDGAKVGNRGIVWIDSNRSDKYANLGKGNMPCTGTSGYKITERKVGVTVKDLSLTFDNTNQTIDLSKLNVTYDKYVDTDSAGSVNQRTFELSLDGSTWVSSVAFGINGATDSRNVQYRVTAPNHETKSGQFAVTINKANITIPIVQYSQYYGGTLLTSDEIMQQMVRNDMPNILNATNFTETKALLNQIINKFVIGTVNSPIVDDGVNHPNANTYSIDYERNSEWNDKIGDITLTNASNAYVINKRPVKVTWTQKTNMWYDGQGGKRPDAAIASIDTSDGFVASDELELDSVEIIDDNGEVIDEAINAGTYKVNVEFKNTDYNKNYVVDADSLEQGTFKILQRTIKVNLLDRERTYADGNITAAEVWKNFMNTTFPQNTDGKVYTLSLGADVTDGKGAIATGDSVPEVFTILLDENVQYTQDGRFYVVNESGYELKLSLLDNNYKLTSDSSGAKFFVKPADITYSAQQQQPKIYIGKNQEFPIDTNRITLNGYEADKVAQSVTIQYKADLDGFRDFSENPIEFKNAGSVEISYSISAPNHAVKTGTFTATIAQATVTIDIERGSATNSNATYGDKIPTSSELETIMGIKYIWPDENYSFDLSDKLEYHLYGGGEGSDIITSRRAKVGSYTVAYSFINGENSANINVRYATDENGNTKNVGAYYIGQKALYVEWKQSGEGWSEDGKSFTYNSKAPKIQPYAPDTVDGKENVVVADDGRDNITLEEITLSSSIVGQYNVATSLRQPQNIENYYIIDDCKEATFAIVPLDVEIYIKDQSADYGNAKTVHLGTSLLAPDSAGALWEYAGSNTFFGDDYSSFRLVSDAHSAPDGSYMDVGIYDIDIEPAENASISVFGNYNPIKLTTDGKSAKFTIKEAKIIYSGREFNIDISKEAGEKGIVTKQQVAQRISTAANTPDNEFTVEMSDLISGGEDKNIEDLTESDWVETQTREIDDKNVGSYYIWIRISHKNSNDKCNYQQFTAKISVNIWTDWVSITISKGVDAEYGYNVYESDEIFEKLTFESITGIVDANGSNKQLGEAIAELKTYVEFFVGSGDTTNPMTGTNKYGTYSIFMKVVDNSKYQHFRFKPYGDSSNTSNIGAYVVGARKIDIEWGSMDEIYGDHGNSHNYTVTGGMPEDGDLYAFVTVEYYSLDEQGNPTLIDGVHARNVGKYMAKVKSVSHPNYRLPDEELVKEFQITKREVDIAISDRTIRYGAAEATRNGINTFLNAVAAGSKLFEVMSGSFVDENTADIFQLNIGSYSLAQEFNYISAGDYTVGITMKGSLSNNYTVNVVDGGVGYQGKLNVAKANISYMREIIRSKIYTGEQISVAPDKVKDYITLQGDSELLKGDDYMKVSYKYKIGGIESDFSEDCSVKDAGTYLIYIKIEAANHEVYTSTEPLTFEVQKVYVEIKMSSTQKTYGDTEQDLLNASGETSFSDWLKTKCLIQYTTYYYDANSGQRVNCNVVGVNDDFAFQVLEHGNDNPILQVGKNNVGKYRVYHVASSQISKNYEVVYFRQEGASDTCNAEAYEIIKRKVQVEWTADNAIAGSNGKKFEYVGRDVVADGENNSALLKAWFMAVGETSPTRILLSVEMLSGESDKERVSAINVGKWRASVLEEGGMGITQYTNNYEFENKTYDFEIVPKKVTVTVKNMNDVVYGGPRSKVDAQLSPVFTTTDEDIRGYIVWKIKGVNTDKKYYGVGDDYRVYGTCTSSNYEVTIIGSESNQDYAMVSIKAADMTVNFPRHTATYNGKPYVVDVKQLLANSNDVEYTFAGDMTLEDIKVLYKQANGSYSEQMPSITGVTGSEGMVIRYQIQLANHLTKDLDMTVVVNPARLIINVSGGASSVYGADLLSSDEIFAKANITIDEESTIKGIDLKKYIRFSVKVNGVAEVDKYELICEFIDAENENYFDLTLNGASEAYEITPKEIVIKWSAQEFVYNGQEQSITATVEGAINNDVVNVTYQGNTGVNAGKYTAKAIAIDNKNYRLGESATFEWSIAPKSIRVEWTAGDFTYDGNEHLVGAPSVVEGLVNNDECEITVTGEKINAGTHTAVAETVNANYTVENSTFEFVIKQAVVTVTWDETALTYNGLEQAPKAIISSGVIAGDKCDIAVSGAQKNAGSDYTATATLSNSNYKIETNASKTFAIAPKAITFTWANTSFTYTGSQQVPNAVAVGAIENDQVDFEIEIVEGENQGVNVGNYTAIVKGVKANSNYVIDSANQTSMSTAYSISKGVNSFKTELSLPTVVNKLPWSGDDKPKAEWGEVVVKYYTDEACTQEIKDINNASEGIYWVKATVAGTSNYDEISSQVFKIELQGGFNVTPVVLGAIASLMLLVGALAVVIATNKKKQQGGAV